MATLHVGHVNVQIANCCGNTRNLAQHPPMPGCARVAD
jgi:hypothetical protein